MRKTRRMRPVVASALVLAMVLSLTGLLGAAATTVKLTGLKSGARVSGEITVQASVKSSDVSYVILGVDQDRPQSSNTPPFSFTLDTAELPDGAHRIFAEAYDRYGLMGSSSVITIYVKNGAASAVQAKQPAKTQLASKPKATAPTRVARAPVTPPARVVAQGRVAKAPVATIPATTETAPATAPLMSGRGPMPAPTRTASASPVIAARTGGVNISASTPATSDMASSLPPVRRASAETVRGHTVVLNGEAVRFDVSPRVVNGRMQVAFRAMFENDGARVTWDAKTRVARSTKGALTVEVPIGQRLAKVNGAPMDLGARASIANGRTMVPVRFFADATGSGLTWDQETRTAMLYRNDQRLALRAPQR